jgi:hypothetical protein
MGDRRDRLRRGHRRRRIDLRAQPLASAPAGSRHSRNPARSRARSRLNIKEKKAMVMAVMQFATLVAIYALWICPIL